MNLDTYFTLWR